MRGSPCKVPPVGRELVIASLWEIWTASATADESRNAFWLALPSFGEAWHNNHHAFPASARHGLSRWNFDPSAWVIWALEKTGLAWDVVRITPERQAAKLVP